MSRGLAIWAARLAVTAQPKAADVWLEKLETDARCASAQFGT